MTRRTNIFLTLIIVALLVYVGKRISEKELGFWTLEQNESTMSLSQSTDRRELLAGDKVTIKFKAKYNNLSNVRFWFDVNNRVNNDTLVFKIKNQDDESLYFKEDIETNKLIQGVPYEFKFPLITSSEGNIYQFEISSLYGTAGNAIYLSNLRSYPAIRYQFDAEYYKSRKLEFPKFLLKKVLYYLGDPDIGFGLISVFCVIVFFVLLSIFDSFYESLFFLSFVILFSLIYLHTDNGQILILTQITLWTTVNIGLRISSRVSAFMSFVFLSIATLFHLFGLSNLAENFATWSVVFVASTAIIQNTQFSHHPVISFEQFWTMIVNYLKLSFRFIYEGSFLVTQKKDTDFHDVYAVFSSNDVSISSKREMLGKISGKSYRTIGTFLIYTPLIILFGLIVSLIWSIALNIKQVQNVINLYLHHFPDNQINLFIRNSGIFFSVWYFLVLVATYLTLKIRFRNRIIFSNLRYKLLLSCLVLYILRFGGGIVSDLTTRNFRDSILIWNISPSSTTEAWIDITVRGVNFGELPFQGIVYINNIPHRIIKWTDKEVVFRTNPVETKSGKVSLENADGRVSNQVDLLYNFK